MSRPGSEVGLGEGEAFRYRLPDLSTTFSPSLNAGILALVEEAKRQRGDLLKLGGELRQSRAQVDKRAVEDARARQEAAAALRQLRKERDEAAGEARVLRDMLGLGERKLYEKDEAIDELRNRASDYLRQINELQLELESARFALSKQQLGTDEAARARRAGEEAGVARSMDAKLAELFEKYREESQKSLRLQHELKEAADANARLALENDMLNRRLAQPDPGRSSASAPLLQELRASLAAFERLQASTAELLGPATSVR